MNIDWSAFLQSLMIEFFSVVILGGIVAIVLDYQRKKYEAHQTQQISREAKQRYLIYIKDEININLRSLQGKDTKNQGPPAMIFRTTYWEALMPSGLLPSLLEPGLLSGISDFYHSLRALNYHLTEIKSFIKDFPTGPGADMLLRHYLEEEKRLEPFFLELGSIAEEGPKLIRRLEKEIESLKKTGKFTNHE